MCLPVFSSAAVEAAKAKCANHKCALVYLLPSDVLKLFPQKPKVQSKINRLAKALKRNAPLGSLPKIHIVFQTGEHIVEDLDGFHRVLLHQQLGCSRVPVVLESNSELNGPICVWSSDKTVNISISLI